MANLLRIAASLLETRFVTRPGLTRTAFEHWQARRLSRWLSRDLPKVSRYRGFSGRLADLPIIDKAEMMGDFAAFNRGALAADSCFDAIAHGGRIGDLSVGMSSGTSGNRGLYVITAAERDRWLGTMLAKALPGFPLKPERVAVLLPQNSALYDNAGRASRQLALTFIDLHRPLSDWLDELIAFRPSVIVAPPRILTRLAIDASDLRPELVFSAAETLDPQDRDAIATGFGVDVREIYMATEGLFAVTCRLGRLHLAEDANHFAFEPAGNGLVNPVITSFRRSFQILARYRMNDFLRLDPDPCPCGSPLTVCAEVVGRSDDVFRFPDGAGTIDITPDIIRNTVLDADRSITDFQVIQEQDDSVSLMLPGDVSGDVAVAASRALAALFARHGVTVEPRAGTLLLEVDGPVKRRRVMRRKRPEGW